MAIAISIYVLGAFITAAFLSLEMGAEALLVSVAWPLIWVCAGFGYARERLRFTKNEPRELIAEHDERDLTPPFGKQQHSSSDIVLGGDPEDWTTLL